MDGDYLKGRRREMLKKTLHTAVAAIAVSTMCLPTAEAKEDLVLDFGIAETYMVAKRVSGTGLQFEDGVIDFDGKTLESHKAFREFVGPDQVVVGTHTVCDPRHTVFIPLEATILLRGSNPKNTLTLDSQRWEESADLTNELASGLCLEPVEGTSQYIVDGRITLDIADATEKWSCAYLNGSYVSFVKDNLFTINPDTTIVGTRNVFFQPVEQAWTGTVVIPRSEGC
jgi:hypothetical protein